MLTSEPRSRSLLMTRGCTLGWDAPTEVCGQSPCHKSQESPRALVQSRPFGSRGRKGSERGTQRSAQAPARRVGYRASSPHKKVRTDIDPG
jgi:hypothetical protein